MPGFVHTERVRFGDLDALRHLNNVVFLRYYESARIDYVRSLSSEHDREAFGSEPTSLSPGPAAGGDGFGLIFAECHINYRSPVHYDEELTIRCRISDVARSSFRIPFEMHVGDRLCAEGYGVLVGFDYSAQRATPLPVGLVAALEAEVSATAD